MKNADLLFESLAVVFTATQTQAIFQIVSLVLTIIATLFSIITRIIVWYKKAKEDGKITADEVEELHEIVEEEKDKLNNSKGE